MVLPSNLGMTLLSVWLILFGVLSSPSLGVRFAGSGELLAILAIVTGVLLYMRR